MFSEERPVCSAGHIPAPWTTFLLVRPGAGSLAGMPILESQARANYHGSKAAASWGPPCQHVLTFRHSLVPHFWKSTLCSSGSQPSRATAWIPQGTNSGKVPHELLELLTASRRCSPVSPHVSVSCLTEPPELLLFQRAGLGVAYLPPAEAQMPSILLGTSLVLALTAPAFLLYLVSCVLNEVRAYSLASPSVIGMLRETHRSERVPRC